MKYVLTILLLCITMQSQAQEIYPFETAKQTAQFTHLLKELRCLVCQNQDLSDSHAPLAKDLKLIVYNLVKEGKSDQEIQTFLTDRYGDFILFKPPVKNATIFLWGGPLVFLIAGMFIFWRSTKRKVECLY